jgi:hypothetical protein
MELLRAAKKGDLNEARLLLQRGADVNYSDEVCHAFPPHFLTIFSEGRYFSPLGLQEWSS